MAHLRRRLRGWPRPAGRRPRFVELGAGRGTFSRLFLEHGFEGLAIDLNADACAVNRESNLEFIAAGRFQVVCASFFEIELPREVDVFFAAMVLEHLPEETVEAYLAAARARLAPGGRIAILVPAGNRYWGIEDEVAGHLRRYSFDDLRALAGKVDLRVVDLRGLTFPVSNWLLPLSNLLVRRAEGDLRALAAGERTRRSGTRHVPLKTVFPPASRLVLNRVTLWPFDLAQRIFRHSERSLVLYCEMSVY